MSAGVIDNLSKDHRVIAFDSRGHGLSGKPHDAGQYGKEMALDIVRLLDHLRIRRAHIVGYSLGGHLTSLLLTLEPDRFLTATLLAAAGRFQWTRKDDETSALEAMRDLAPRDAPPSDETIRKQSAAALADPARDRFAIAALMRSRGAQAIITPEQVQAVKVPTLAVVGSLDPGLAQFRELQKLRPSVKLVVIDGATHGGERGVMARPEFVAALRAFISR